MQAAMQLVESGAIRASCRRRGDAVHRGEAWRVHQVKSSTTNVRGCIGGAKHSGGRSGLTRIWEIVHMEK